MVGRFEQDYVFRDRDPERDTVYRLFDNRTAEARHSLECRLDIPCGPAEREMFDLCLGEAGGPLLLFIHGGYWQSLSKDRFGFVAKPFVELGFSVALPNYPLAPDAPLAAIVDSVSGSVPAVLRELAAAGRRPPFWIVSGHSAGGHLAATLAVQEQPVVPLPLAACVPISGIFALEPVVETSLNRALRLSLEAAAALGPLRSGRSPGRLAAFVGADETPGFIRQSEDYVRHCRLLGAEAALVRLSKRNHYTILCDLLEEQSQIAKRIENLARGFQGGGRR